MTKRDQPPFTLNAAVVSLVAAIGERVGRLDAIAARSRSLRLRRINRIRTIRGSLAIEGNTLSEEQITAILDGKPVIAPPRDVLEARNALAAYEQLPHWQPTSEAHLLAAHAMLMKGLADDAGRYRRGGVGVMQGERVVHMAPPAGRVAGLMRNLLAWLKETDQHPLIASCVFHYEFEFIHPFSDGNGRMGRLWQSLILSRWNRVFAWVPVESLVHAHQADYYAALAESTRRGDSGVFIEFMLARLNEALDVAVSERTVARKVATPEVTPEVTGEVNGEVAEEVTGEVAPPVTPSATPEVTPEVTREVAPEVSVVGVLKGEMTRRELQQALGLKDDEHFRLAYLLPALNAGLIEMTIPDKPTSRLQKYRLTDKGLALARRNAP